VSLMEVKIFIMKISRTRSSQMNTDIRIAISFKNHRKRKKLKLLLGPDSTDYLIDLWLTVAMERPDGDLSGLDDMDIAIMAGWPNDPSTFVGALVNVGWLDVATKSNGGYILHDWLENNPWVSSADERSDKARFSRLSRSYPDIHAVLKGQGYKTITAEEYKTVIKTGGLTNLTNRTTNVEQPLLRPLTNRTTPSPSPSPSPSLKTEEVLTFEAKDQTKAFMPVETVDNSEVSMATPLIVDVPRGLPPVDNSVENPQSLEKHGEYEKLSDAPPSATILRLPVNAGVG